MNVELCRSQKKQNRQSKAIRTALCYIELIISKDTGVEWGEGPLQGTNRDSEPQPCSGDSPSLPALQKPPRTLWESTGLAEIYMHTQPSSRALGRADIVFEEAVGVTKRPALDISELAGKSSLLGAEGSGSCNLGVERAL